jgi:LysM repeat protein
LIVLLLHVVAISGIIAFNAIKTRQGLGISAATAPATNITAIPAEAKPIGSNPIGLAAKLNAKAPAKENAKSERKSDADKLPEASGKVYVVAKGDNPVTIAKKFKVSYDDLLAINHIDDPRKLKIGQKLLIPAKPEKNKKSAD